jgi:hypothetical protein
MNAAMKNIVVIVRKAISCVIMRAAREGGPRGR